MIFGGVIGSGSTSCSLIFSHESVIGHVTIIYVKLIGSMQVNIEVRE